LAWDPYLFDVDADDADEFLSNKVRDDQKKPV